MATLEQVDVPDIGDFTDIPITEVLVSVGDTIEVEAPLVEIESDKATMEVPSTVAGVVREILVAVGDKVSQGTPLVKVEAAGNGAAPPAPDDAPLAEADSPSAVASAVVAEAQAEPAPAGGNGDGSPVHASPLARRMATDLGVNLESVQGSGPHGRITKDDVSAAASGRRVEPQRPSPSSEPHSTERVALTKIQRASAANLQEAWRTIPHVTQHEEADITELEAFRKQLNAEQSDVKVTMVALLLKACAATLDAFPRFASSLDGDELVVRGERHLGFAADTPNGLVVPVIKDVDRKGLLELAAELTDLSGRARAGKLTMRDLSGAVFTVSSLGGIGGTGFTPIVNPPQVAILGVVRSATRPVWDGKEFVPRLMLPLSLSYDHRVIDGAAAARFCAHLAGVLSDLRRVLL